MLKRSVWLFIYSTPNLIGSIWGLIGLIAFRYHIINDYWFFIVIGLYASGYLISPKNEVIYSQQSLEQDISAQELEKKLAALSKKIRNRVSPAILAKVEHIKENVLMILPRLDKINSTDYDLHVVKQTVTDYLPHMLSTYLELPPLFAIMHKIRNGKTSQELLIEQLEILDEQIEQILISVNSKDADALIAHGEFLKGKFAGDNHWL